MPDTPPETPKAAPENQPKAPADSPPKAAPENPPKAPENAPKAAAEEPRTALRAADTPPETPQPAAANTPRKEDDANFTAPITPAEQLALDNLAAVKERSKDEEKEYGRLMAMSKAPRQLSHQGWARLDQLNRMSHPSDAEKAEMDSLNKAVDARNKWRHDEDVRLMKEAAGPFDLEHWTHLKAWVRREMRLSQAGDPPHLQDKRNP